MGVDPTKFSASAASEKLAANMVLKVGTDGKASYWRITHVFDKNAYVMEVSTPEMARYARRPQPRRLSDLLELRKSGKARLGKIRLPAEFLSTTGSKTPDDDESASMEPIRPLVTAFDAEQNLSRWTFTKLIADRAAELGISAVTLRRLLLRYYYFGRLEAALRPLAPGPAVGAAKTPDEKQPDDEQVAEKVQRRRGRQPIEAQELGRNEFIVNEADIADMLECLEARAKRSLTTITAAYKEYLKTKFAKRHPKVYAAYLAKKCPVPVTRRQFDYYTSLYADLASTVADNIPAFKRRTTTVGGLIAAGPGEMYEIDATGGRVYLVDSRPPHRVLGKPIIYLMIDRWSRYVVSAYVTLRPASWEEIRFALLIAFTSRDRRFKTLGVDINDKRWPPGKVCAVLVADRGSEMISEAMLEAAAKGLKIDPVFMPPFTPDGKAIIERLIGVLKQRMAQRGIKGVYAERPIDPLKKRAAKRARQAAAHNLREIYWELIEIIEEYNNRSHSTLEKRSILKRNRVRPTPQAAYLWGLEHITGIQSPPLTDDDYRRLLLGVDKATLGNGYVTYRSRKYLPANAAARKRAKVSTSRRRSIDIKVDRSDPVEIYEPTGSEEWPLWRVNAVGLQDLRDTTLEEEDGLEDSDRLLVATTRNDSLISELQRKPKRTRRPSKPGAPEGPLSEAEAARRRASESQDLKRGLLGAQPPKKRQTPPKSPVTQSAEAIEEEERLATIAAMQRRRK